MKKLKHIFGILMAVLMLFSIAACGGDGDSTPTPDVEQTDDPGNSVEKWQPPANFGGRTFVIGDWWTPVDLPPSKPKNIREEQIQDLRDYLEAEYGFTFKQMTISSWEDYLEFFNTANISGTHEADIYIMSSTWACLMMGQGMLYPLNTLDSLDLSDNRWNSAITDMFTDSDGNVFAISNAKYVEPRNFLFYNKRLFREAGIDPEAPYDLQASGEWTWDKFYEFCEMLTRDTDGDGIPDTYAFTGFWGPTQTAFINSNDARHIGVGNDGLFYNAMYEPNYIEAMEFVQKFYDAGHWTLGPEDASWDWFNQGFADGMAAMCIPIGAYQSEAWQSMDDDWGMVFCPKGPRASDYNTMFEENVYVLPHNLDKDKAEEIIYAFSLWTDPVQYEKDNPDWWKDGVWGYSRYKDMRAVDDTLAMFYEGRMEINSKILIDPGTTNWWGETYDWGAVQNREVSVIEKIDASAPVIQAQIDKVNAQAGG